MIISRTPFRVSFFGGGTDFPEFYEEHSGATLATTINQYCYISVHQLSDFFKYRFRASYAKTERVHTPSEFKHPLIRECLGFLDLKKGMEISHVADLPGRAGLGSSSSYTVGLLCALHAFRGEPVSAEQLAKEAITVERERVGDAGGHQDQYAAAYGGLLRVDYGPSRKIVVKRLELPEFRIREFQQHLVMFYTGTDKSAQDILREQSRRVNLNTSALLEMRQMVDDAEQILAGNGDFSGFGELLHHTWELKKTLSSGITNSLVDNAYDAARRAGAVGGKLLGAGGRGFLLILAAQPAALSASCRGKRAAGGARSFCSHTACFKPGSSGTGPDLSPTSQPASDRCSGVQALCLAGEGERGSIPRSG